jgi:low affinity Fe/Cu permease
MHKKQTHRIGRAFDAFANIVTRITGTPWAFCIAIFIVLIWAVTGPVFDYSDTWQLVINTGTTIVTFLMVFVIQQSQNKDTMALHLKLNELIGASDKASNRLIDIEDLTEDELQLIKKYYVTLSGISKRQKELQRSHSIEELETQKIEEQIQEDKSEKSPKGKNS